MAYASAYRWNAWYPPAKEGRYGQALIDGIEGPVNRILMDPRYREEILSTTDAYGNDTRSFLRKPVSPGWLIGLGLPWILFQWLGWNSEKKGIKKAPAYVKSNFSSMTSASRRTFLGGTAAALVSSQLMTGMLRVGEFLLILYGILILLTIIKRYRLNHWITQYTEGKEAYTVHQQMQQSHSNGWGAAAIFMPVPMLGYWFWYKRNQHKLRNTPPLSSSGIPMEKLDEKSDDAYLKDVQITEERSSPSTMMSGWTVSGETTVYRYDLGSRPIPPARIVAARPGSIPRQRPWWQPLIPAPEKDKRPIPVNIGGMLPIPHLPSL